MATSPPRKTVPGIPASTVTPRAQNRTLAAEGAPEEGLAAGSEDRARLAPDPPRPKSVRVRCPRWRRERNARFHGPDIKRPEPLEKKRRVKIYMAADGKGKTVPGSDLLRKTGGVRGSAGVPRRVRRGSSHPLAHLDERISHNADANITFQKPGIHLTPMPSAPSGVER